MAGETNKSALVKKIISLKRGWAENTLKRLSIKDLERILSCGDPTTPTAPLKITSPKGKVVVPSKPKSTPKPKPASKPKGPTKAELVEKIHQFGDTSASSKLMRMTLAQLTARLSALETGDFPLAEEPDEDDLWRQANPSDKTKYGSHATYRLMGAIEAIEARELAKLGGKPPTPRAPTPKPPTPRARTPDTKPLPGIPTPKPPTPKPPTPKPPTPKPPTPKPPSPQVITLVPRRKPRPQV